MHNIMKSIKLNNNFEKGFTLIELMVSIALFTTVALIATTALTSIQKVNVRVQNVRTVMDNLALSLETISSEVRQGSNYHCYESSDIDNSTHIMRKAKNCGVVTAASENALIFKVNTDTESSLTSPRVAYMLQTNSDGVGVIKRYRSPNVSPSGNDLKDGDFDSAFIDGGTSEQITSNDVNVTKLKFTVKGESNPISNSTGDGQQPYVLIEMEGETRTTPPQSFKLQTVVTSRNVSY